jgi:tetratricopeptide (TPR) repeat protein
LNIDMDRITTHCLAILAGAFSLVGAASDDVDQRLRDAVQTPRMHFFFSSGLNPFSSFDAVDASTNPVAALTRLEHAMDGGDGDAERWEGVERCRKVLHDVFGAMAARSNAVEILRRRLAGHPESAAASVALANALLSTTDGADEAESLCRKVVEKHPDDGAAHLALARAIGAMRGRFFGRSDRDRHADDIDRLAAEERREYDKAASLRPTDPEPLVLRGLAAVFNYKAGLVPNAHGAAAIQSAWDDFQAAEKLAPEDHRILLLRCFARSQVIANEPPSRFPAVVRGDDAYCISRLRMLAGESRDPARGAAYWEAVVIVKFVQGETDVDWAVSLALERNPERFDAWNFRAALLSDAPDRTKLARFVEETLRRGEHLQARLLAAQLAFEKRKMDEFWNHCSKIAAVCPRIAPLAGFRSAGLLATARTTSELDAAAEANRKAVELAATVDDVDERETFKTKLKIDEAILVALRGDKAEARRMLRPWLGRDADEYAGKIDHVLSE